MAQKWGIPVVSIAFIEDSVAAGKLLEADNYTVAGKTASEQLSSGKIVGESRGTALDVLGCIHTSLCPHIMFAVTHDSVGYTYSNDIVMLPLSHLTASMTDKEKKKKRPRSTVNMNQLK